MTLLKTAEVAERLRCSAYTVRARIKSGAIKAMFDGKSFFVEESEVDRFIASRQHRPSSPGPTRRHGRRS